jgi:hypothetical protein
VRRPAARQNDDRITQNVHILVCQTFPSRSRNPWDHQAKQKTKSQIERSSDQPFQLHDLQRIRQRDLACKVIVEAPGYAGSDNGKWAKHVVYGRST